MDAINAVASLLNRSIDVGTAYFKANAVAIGILLAAVYYIRTRYPNGRPSPGYVLSSSSSSDRSGEQGQTGLSSTTNNTSSKNNHISSHEEDMRQVRQRQQEIADERAKEAAIKRKEKEAEEKERKNNVAKKKAATTGNKLGDGRNPMQPATSNTSSSYRRASRNPRA